MNMPTKPNRSGQQQNYVPQGNGDASGEYADEATGSNVHFTSFKKPDEPTEEKKIEHFEKPQEDTDKYLGGSKTKSDFSATVFSKGMLKYGEEFENTFKRVIANADETCIGVINHSIMNHGIFFIKDKDENRCSYFKPQTKEINIKADELARAYDEEGETVFHELGHYLNEVNRIREDEKWYMTDNIMTSTHSYFDDKLSVAETLQEELKEFAAAKHAASIRAEQRKYVNAKLKPHGFTAQEYEKLLDKGNDLIRTNAEWLDIKDNIKNDYMNGEITVDEANKRVQIALANWKKNGSYKDVFSKLDEQRPHYRKYMDEWTKVNGIKAVSDVWSSKSNFGFGYGHSRDYYKKSWMNPNPEERLADELFANYFAAMTTHNQQVLETTKKYFPKTCEKMVKLVEILNDKKKKHDEMKEVIDKFQRGETI